MADPTPTFYLFHGDDAFKIAEQVAKMRERMGDPSTAELNTAEFDGQTADISDILNAANAYPFLSDKRLVLVKDMMAWLGRKGAGETGKRALERLALELPVLPDWARVVFIERETLPETHKLLRLAREHARGFEKAFLAPKDTTSWIIKRAKEMYNTVIEPAAASALASVTSDDLYRADNELSKLASYVNEERPIKEADVALLTPYVAEAGMFDMVDALAEGRGPAAARLLHRLMETEEPLGLYGMIIRQFRLLLLAKEHLTTGGYPNTLAEALRIKAFPAEKLAKQSRAFTVDQLEAIYRTLLDTDIKMKTGQIDPALALDLLIASLSRG